MAMDTRVWVANQSVQKKLSTVLAYTKPGKALLKIVIEFDKSSSQNMVLWFTYWIIIWWLLEQLDCNRHQLISAISKE